MPAGVHGTLTVHDLDAAYELRLDDADALLDPAVARRHGPALAAVLQRRLAIGYSRSSRIIDQMADAGILGDYKGSQARECLLTLEDWQALQANIAADQSGENSANGEPTSS